ncbi:MAG: hypothetical protein HRU11_13545 [Parvularculaceae bacterium]|nr:hypothetical protein [Parvularculaceae bacterium]
MSARMLDPEDVDERDAVGALDRVVTNVCLAAMAVLPTFFIAAVQPWRVRSLIIKEHEGGRVGMLLAPGAFMTISLIGLLLFVAMLDGGPTVKMNGGTVLIGPALANQLAEALGQGELWRAIGLLLPIYGLAVVYAALSQVLRPLLGPWWNARAALRCGFYLIGTLNTWIILAALSIRRLIGSDDIGFAEFAFLASTWIALALVVWQQWWFFRRAGQLTRLRCTAAAILGTVAMGVSFGLVAAALPASEVSSEAAASESPAPQLQE